MPLTHKEMQCGDYTSKGITHPCSLGFPLSQYPELGKLHEQTETFGYDCVNEGSQLLDRNLFKAKKFSKTVLAESNFSASVPISAK